MRVWQLPGSELRHDATEYTTATPASGLTIKPSYYVMGVGNNVLKYRQIEILDAVKWLVTRATAGLDTTRFPRPAYGVNGGGTFLRASLISTASGPKWSHSLVTDTDITSNPITDENSVYWGYTVGTAALAVNDPALMGSHGHFLAYEEIRQYYIQSAQAAA